MMNDVEQWLRESIVAGFLGRIPIVESDFIEPARRWVCVDKDGARVGLEFSEAVGQAEQFLQDRMMRRVRREDEVLMIGELRICGLCALPMVDLDVCPANPYGPNHEQFVYTESVKGFTK